MDNNNNNNNANPRRMASIALRFIVQMIQRIGLAVFGIELTLRDNSKAFNYQEKAKRIEECLGETRVDLWKLRQLALSKGGLLEGKSCRRRRRK
jgi:hypothetical protein